MPGRLPVYLKISLFCIECRAVEIPFPTCPTWSHFIQDKLEISIYLSWDKFKENYFFLYFIFHNYDKLTCCLENSVDPDQLASEEVN